MTRSTWIRALVTVGILAYLSTGIDLAEAGAALLSLHARAILIVALLLVVDRGLMIWRWVLLLRSAGTAVALESAVWIHLVSSFVGSFLPAGVGADALRAYTLGQRTAENSEAIASVAVDRVLGLSSIVLLGLVGLAVWAGRFDASLTQVAGLGAIFAAGLTSGLFWADRLLRAALPERWHGSTHGRRVLILGDALGRYRRRGRTLGVVFLVSIAVQIIRVVEAYVLGRGIGIDVAFAYYLVFMPVGLLMLLLPVSISGFGLPQGVIVWLLRPQGVPDAASFALSTLIVLTGLAGNLPGAWLYLRARKA